MEFIERILDLIEEAVLHRKQLERFIVNHSNELIENLIIILKYEDPDYIHHLTEAFANFRKLQIRTIKGKFNETDCYSWIFHQNFNKSIKKIILRYNKLRIIRTNEEVYNELQKILKVIAHDICNHCLNDIWYYIPKDINFQNNLNKLIELGYE